MKQPSFTQVLLIIAVVLLAVAAFFVWRTDQRADSIALATQAQVSATQTRVAVVKQTQDFVTAVANALAAAGTPTPNQILPASTSAGPAFLVVDAAFCANKKPLIIEAGLPAIAPCAGIWKYTVINPHKGNETTYTKISQSFTDWAELLKWLNGSGYGFGSVWAEDPNLALTAQPTATLAATGTPATAGIYADFCANRKAIILDDGPLPASSPCTAAVTTFTVVGARFNKDTKDDTQKVFTDWATMLQWLNDKQFRYGSVWAQ